MGREEVGKVGGSVYFFGDTLEILGRSLCCVGFFEIVMIINIGSCR